MGCHVAYNYYVELWIVTREDMQGFIQKIFFAGDVGMTVSRTVSPLPPLTIDIDSDVFWYFTEVLRGFI